MCYVWSSYETGTKLGNKKFRQFHVQNLNIIQFDGSHVNVPWHIELTELGTFLYYLIAVYLHSFYVNGCICKFGIEVFFAVRVVVGDAIVARTAYQHYDRCFACVISGENEETKTRQKMWMKVMKMKWIQIL